jgi:cyclophilin family peptidyl-prolyl cis-trans isomerase
VPRLRLTAVLVAATAGLAACGDDATVSTPTTSKAPATKEAAVAPEPAGACKKVQQPGPKDAESPKPKAPLGKGTYTVVMTTSCGVIEIRLDKKEDPKTAASFAGLVKSKFFDGLSFHRVVPGFVIQGGDPTGSGSGGPGYSVVEAPPSDQQYVKGVVAMAKAPAEKPGTSGSQFFIVTGDATQLPPEYAVAGTVVKGQDVADEIAAIPPQGGSDGPPSEPVVIEKATLKVG